MPPVNLGQILSASASMPHAKKTKQVLPKIVKKMTTEKGDRLILTKLNKNSKYGDPNLKETILTLYKEVVLAKGLNSYQKLEEKIVSKNKGKIYSRTKSVFNDKGEVIAKTGTYDKIFFAHSPEIKIDLRAQEPAIFFVPQLSIKTNGEIDPKNLRPEAKRALKLLGQGKINNLLTK